MAEQFLLKVCSITLQCCDRYSQCNMDDRGPFHDKNIQASFADKCSLKAARRIWHKHISIGGGGCITDA